MIVHKADASPFFVLAIYQILPELEKFLRVTLAKEQLSEEANTIREEFIGKLETLIKPPVLPPRSKTVSASPGPSNQPVNIPEQRALSWRMTPGTNLGTSAPYQSKKRHNGEGSIAVSTSFIYKHQLALLAS